MTLWTWRTRPATDLAVPTLAAAELGAADRGAEDALIRLEGVTKVYHAAAGQVQALRGISAEIRPGEFVAVVGKSGAGKSTLVNMLTGVDALTAGEVWVRGTPVHALGENRMALWRGLNLGIVYQSFQLLPQLSILDNVTLPMDFCGRFRPGESQARALELLRLVGLEDHAHKPPTAISGGQQQRVAIARALANDPPILVADEPTGNLDASTAAEVLALFEGLVAQGKTLILVTHDALLANRASRVLRLVDGELVDDADPRWN